MVEQAADDNDDDDDMGKFALLNLSIELSCCGSTYLRAFLCNRKLVSHFSMA